MAACDARLGEVESNILLIKEITNSDKDLAVKRRSSRSIKCNSKLPMMLLKSLPYQS